MESDIPTCWQYRGLSFYTKRDRDMYQRGFEDALKESQDDKKQHIRTDV